MRLGLLGSGIQHSLSPKLYQEFLGKRLTSYELFDFSDAKEIPGLTDFAAKLDGLSITAPYKSHFLSEVSFKDPELRDLGGINCISFSKKFWATNTDYLALKDLIPTFLASYPHHEIVLLGDGVMARITQMILSSLNCQFHHYSRKTHGDISELDLQKEFSHPVLMINSCSRDFIFRGKASSESIFWDYNYSFRSHSETLPQRFKTYIDGLDLLRRQALSAITFWHETNPKFKC